MLVHIPGLDINLCVNAVADRYIGPVLIKKIIIDLVLILDIQKDLILEGAKKTFTKDIFWLCKRDDCSYPIAKALGEDVLCCPFNKSLFKPDAI